MLLLVSVLEMCWRYALVLGPAGLRSAAALHFRAAEPFLVHFATPKAPQSIGKPPHQSVLQSNVDSCNASSFFPPFHFSPRAEVRGKRLTLAACDGSRSASGLQLRSHTTPGGRVGPPRPSPNHSFCLRVASVRVIQGCPLGDTCVLQLRDHRPVPHRLHREMWFQ